ncbi:MAG: hypothetical protein J7K36_03195 [Archaeoglobaceae archaeon]|nr:hypothetical protein [Archaeoglobaceae archaeon]
MDFSKIADEYMPVVQLSAGEKLLELLNIREHENVLDLGCGDGRLTAKIRKGKEI